MILHLCVIVMICMIGRRNFFSFVAGPAIEASLFVPDKTFQTNLIPRLQCSIMSSRHALLVNNGPALKTCTQPTLEQTLTCLFWPIIRDKDWKVTLKPEVEFIVITTLKEAK